MWIDFWFAVLVGAIFIFAPGCLVLRAFGYPKIAAFAGAPIIALLAYCIIAIIYDVVGVWANGWNLLVPVLALGVVSYVTSLCVASRRKNARHDDRKYKKVGHSSQYCFVFIYCLVGALAAVYAFSGNLSTPNSSTITYDDCMHLGAIRSFIETGSYSSLSVNYEYDIPGESGGYYPAAWHLLAASIATICNIPVMVAANAAIFVSSAFIFPAGCLFLMRTLFGDEKTMLVSGAFMAVVFVAFPWHLLEYGRLISNLLAFATVPTMLACAIKLFANGVSRATRARAFALAFAGCFLSLFTQPNAVFTLIVFASPYVMCRIWQSPINAMSKHAVAIKLLRECAFSIAMLAFLMICYVSPLFYDVTHFKWDAPITVGRAIWNVLLQGTWFGPCSPLLGVLTVGGCVYAATRRKDLRWIVAVFLIVAIMYVVDAGTNSRVKHWLTGFWYTDQHRISAMFAMISYPLAVCGLGALCQFAKKRIKSPFAGEAVCMLLIGLSTVTMMFPSFFMPDGSEVETPFGLQRRLVKDCYSSDMPDNQVVFSGEEQAFVKKVAGITGDSLVYNIPMDGSMFAYQFDGVRTYYRYPFDGLDSKTESRLLQRNLSGIVDDSSVRRAADNLGIEYVMMLDQGHEPYLEGKWGDFDSANWKGVNEIDENTPGFELVLSEGDMRLYRILPGDEIAQQTSKVKD